MQFAGIHPLASIGGPPEDRGWFAQSGALYDPIIHPTARVNAFVTVDAGKEQPTRVGARTFLLAHAHVGHDAFVGHDCDIATGAIVGGHAVICNSVKLGLGAVVLPYRLVGTGAVVGAGAVITKDVDPGEVVAGNPARCIGLRNPTPYTERR